MTWIVDKAVKNTIWRTDTGFRSRERARGGVPVITAPLTQGGFPSDPGKAKEQIGGRFPKGQLLSDDEWSAFEQLSSTPQGQAWLNASGMLTHADVERYLSGRDSENPERFRGFHQVHKASKVVLASYVSRQMNSGEAGKRFEGTPPAALALSMEAKHTPDSARRAALQQRIDQSIVDEWSKTLEYTDPNDDASTAIDKGAVPDPQKKFLRPRTTLSKEEVVDRHRQSLDVLKNVFHLLQEGAEIYDGTAKSHVPLQDVPVAKLLSHGGRVNIQIPPSSEPYALTEHLGITDSNGKPRPGVFKRAFGTHHIALDDGKFKEQGGHVAAIKSKLDDTELYGINLAVGGLGLKDFNGDVILPDGAHGHMFIGYRPPKPDRPGALQIGMETTGPGAPSTVGYVHNWRSTEKTANPISSVGGLKSDKIGDESTKNARTVDLGKLGEDWAQTLRDRADRFEQELAAKGKDALNELVGPRSQPPQELEDDSEDEDSEDEDSEDEDEDSDDSEDEDSEDDEDEDSDDSEDDDDEDEDEDSDDSEDEDSEDDDEGDEGDEDSEDDDEGDEDSEDDDEGDEGDDDEGDDDEGDDDDDDDDDGDEDDGDGDEDDGDEDEDEDSDDDDDGDRFGPSQRPQSGREAPSLAPSTPEGGQHARAPHGESPATSQTSGAQGKAPEQPGPPRPQAISQPLAPRPGSPATAITTGMQAPSWLGKKLGTGGHGYAGMRQNEGAAEREQTLADKYELQVGPGDTADGDPADGDTADGDTADGDTAKDTHFSHKMLDHIEKALGELPPEHITGSPTLRKIIRNLSSEQAASEYDEDTDTINIVNPPKVPTFIYSRLNRRWDWQRKRMDRGAMKGYSGVSKEQDDALGITGRRQVMGGVSDALATGNLLKWTIRHEVAHSIDKLVDWSSLAGEDRFGGWKEHSSSRELQAVARALFAKAGISDDKAQQKIDDEGQRDPDGAPLLDRFASLLDPEQRREDMALLEDFPAKFTATDPDLKDRLDRVVRTVKIAMAQPWTLADGGARELQVGDRIYHVDHYDKWVSYRADARNNAVSNYQFSTPKEWFAETYASYNDPDPRPRAQLTQDVRDFFQNELPGLITTGRERWQRSRDRIAQRAGNQPPQPPAAGSSAAGPSAVTVGFSKNTPTVAPSSGSPAASPPHDASGAPKDSPPHDASSAPKDSAAQQADDAHENLGDPQAALQALLEASNTWSHPATNADKQDAKRLLGDLMRSQGVDRSLVDRLAELIDDPDSISQHQFAICALNSVLHTQLTSDLAGFARVVAAEFTGKLFDRDGKLLADFSLDAQGENNATATALPTDPIHRVIRGELPLQDAPIGNKLLQNGVKKAAAKRADLERKGSAFSDAHVLDYLLARGLGKMLSKLAPEQYQADAKYTAGVIPGYLDNTATRAKDAKGPSKKLGDLLLSADSLVTLFTDILGGNAQTLVAGDNYDVGRINDVLARPEQAPFVLATFLDGNGLVERADAFAKDPAKARPFDTVGNIGTSSAHQVVINGKITEDGDHYVVPLHTWQQSFSIKVKKDALPSLFPVFTYGNYLPSGAPGANDATQSQAPENNPWTQLTTGGDDKLGTGGHGIAGAVANKGVAAREQALAAKYNLQIGPGNDAGGKHFSHKMLDRIEKVLGELPLEHVTGNPTLQKIIRDIPKEDIETEQLDEASQEQLTDNPVMRAVKQYISKMGAARAGAASAYDEATDTINVVNPMGMPSWLYSRLNRGVGWQRYLMDLGAKAGYEGIDTKQDKALGIAARRQVMGGVSDVLANGNLVKWTLRHEIGHSIDKLVSWKDDLAGQDRFGGWRVHSDGRELEEVARAILAKAGITDDEANTETDGFSLLQRFASVLHPPSRRKDMAPLVEFPASADPLDADLRKKLEKAVRTVKIAMAQPWTLVDGGASELQVEDRIYQVDHYNEWVSYRADARDNAVSNYQFSTPVEWFAETYASYYDPDPAPKTRLTQDVRDFFENELPDRVTTGHETWQRIRESIARSAGQQPPEGSSASAITSGFNPEASDDPADLLAGYNPASDNEGEAADPQTQTDEIEEEPEPPSERAPDPATSTPVEEVTWIVDKAVKNTIWRTDTGPLSRDRAKQGLSAIQGPLSASGFPPDPTTAKEQLGGRFPGGPLFSDAEWSAFVQLSSTPQGQTWLNASGMLTHDQVEQYLSGNDDDNPERFRGFDKLHKASKVVLASYVSRQMNGGESGKRFEGTPPAAVAISMEARHTTDPARRAELKRLIDQGIIEEWSKTFEYTQPNEAATTAINKGAVLAPKSLLNTLTFTKGKELSKAEVIKRHGQSLKVLKNVFHLLQEGAEIYDADAKSHVPLQDVPVAKLLSHGGRVNVQIPPSSSPYALTEHLGITDSKGKPKPGVFKRFAGTHHVSFADGEFKEEGGRDAFIKAKLDDTELYGINLAVGGLGLKDFNGDVILPDGAHGHMFIGYRPPKPGRPGALQLGMETTGPNAPSTVGYVHNLGSTEKTANPISSVGGLKQDKIGDESTKNARTVDLGKLGSDWRKTLKDRADRFEQELKQRGKDALTELLGPRTQPPQELQDSQQRSADPDQAPRDNERRDPPGDAPVDTLAGYNPASDGGDEAADPQPQTDEIEEEPEPPSERAPDPATSTPVEEVTWIVDKAVKNTLWRTDTGLMSREKAKRGLPAIAAQLSSGGFPRDPGTAKEQLGGRFPKGQLLSDAEWSAFEQLSSTPAGQSWLNASGMLTLDEVKKYLSGNDDENPERFRGFHQLHKASKVVLASYVSRQMNGGESGKRFEGTPPAAVAISMEARHTTDPTRKAELKRLIDKGIVEEWSKTLEYTEPNDDANTAIDKGAVLDPKKKLLQQPKKLSKEQVVDRHRQSLDVLKNVFHLLQEGAEIYDDSAKSHVPLKDAPVAKLLSHGGRVNVQIPAGGAPYELTELLGITDKNGNPAAGVFKRSFGTHHVALSDGTFKEEGGHFAAVKSKLDDTELYGINLAVGGLGLKDFNGDVIVPDGAHGHMFIGYRPPRPGRQGALQIGIETTGPGAPSTVGYVHNLFSTEKTANPISSVGGLKQDKIGDDQIKNARTVDLSKLGSNWAKTLRDRAERFEQDLAQRGKDALTELVGPRTQPPQELLDAQQRSGDTLAGAAAPDASPSPAPTTAGGTAQVEPSAHNQEKTLDELLDSLEEQSRAWSHPATAENKRDANQLLTGLLQRQNVNPSIIDRLRELIENPASLSQSAFTNCALTSILYPTLKNDLATTAHLVAAIFTGKPLGKFADSPRADSSRPQGSSKGALSDSLDLVRRVMTGEVPQSLGPAPTRPLVNGLRTAKAKGDSLKREKDRKELDRHLLDHLLARGLVELLGPDALVNLEQQTDNANQPGVAAAQGDLLASANSVASIFNSALGANTTVMTPSSPGGYDVARLNGALQQTDQAGFAIATVMDGKALWSAAKEHEASSTTPDASENVARLGGTATTAPHHATIDGSITDQGDSFLVPLQSWGRTFPVRVNKEDMPKVFAAITYGTALPPRAPSPTAPAQEQTLADMQAGHNPDSDSGDKAAAPQSRSDEIEEEPEPPSERAPDPATSTPVEEVTWIVDKAVKNTLWRTDTGFLSREKAKRGLPAIAAQLSSGGFPRDPGTAKEQLGGRFPKGQLLSDAEWSAFEQLSSTPAGQSWLNASGMLTLDEVKKYLSGNDDENPERFRGFHQLHKASKVVLASYVSRQMNGGESGKRFEGTPPAAVAISMEARHTTDPTRKAELKRLIDKGIVEEWSKTLEYTEPNDDANTAIDKGAVLDPMKKLLQQPKKLSKEQVVDRHRQSLDVLKNVFHLLQEGAEIYDDSAKSHVPLKDAPVAKLLSHGGRVNVQIPAGGAPYELTELLGITDKNGNPAAGVFKRSFGTHHVALSDGTFKEEGGHFAAVKSKLDDTELYGINLAVGGLGLKDFNGDVIVPDGAHGHMFIGYRPPRPGRQGALQIGIETTGPGAPSTVGYVHNLFSTEKTANPISSVGGLKQDKIGDDQIKNARTVDLSKLGSNWAKTLRDRAERFEQDLAQRGKDALTELVGPRTQPPQELLDAQQRASEQRSELPEQESRDDERRDPPGDAPPDTVRSARAPAVNEGSSRGDGRTSPDAPEDMLAGYNPASGSGDAAADPQPQTDEIEEEPPSERAPDPATSTPVDEVTWIVDKAVKKTIWRPDTGILSREQAKRGLSTIGDPLRNGGFPRDPGEAKAQIGGRLPEGRLFSDAEWSAFEQLSSTPQGRTWLNAAGMLTHADVVKYLSGRDSDNPERFRGFHQLHKASKIVLASYISRQMNGGEGGKRFEGTPPAAIAISMEARHTPDKARRDELEQLINQGIVAEWARTLEHTEPNDDASTAIDKGAVLDPEKKFLRPQTTLSKREVVERHRQSLEVLKNVFHLLQEGAEIYDGTDKSHVPPKDVPVAKLLSHGGRVNIQIPAGSPPYKLTELLGITDKDGKPTTGVFKRSFGTHNVALRDGKFKELGGPLAAIKSKLDDTELYGINLAVGGLGLKDYNGDVILPDGAHGHMFIGYRPPRPGRQGALQIGIETTGPKAPSTDGYIHNWRSTEKTANPVSSVSALKVDKIGDNQIKNARTVDLSKLGDDWAKTLRDRADRFEQDLKQKGKDALNELVGPRTQPPQELQDAQQRSGDERRDPPGEPTDARGKAPERPGQPRPETTSQPPAPRPGSPATAITTGMQAPSWLGKKLGTGGHGYAGMRQNEGAAEREQTLADKYELQVGPGDTADGDPADGDTADGDTAKDTHFSHKMLDHIEKALGELPPEHITGSPTLRKIIRNLSSEQAASEYDEDTDTINIVNPPKVPTFIYSRLNRRWDWQRKRMDRGAMKGYSGVSKEQDDALGITGRRQVMGGVSDALATGNLLKWTIRHEVAHSIDKLVDWSSLAGEDRFGGWKEHSSSRELQAVARALFAKAGISDDKAQQKIDDEGQSDPDGAPLLDRFASLLDPEQRREDMTLLEDFPAKFTATDPDLKDRLDRVVRTVKIAMAQPWTLADGGARELQVGDRIYHVDHYDKWVSYRADARNNAVSNYQFSTPKEWFAETYASYNDPDPRPRAQLTQDVRDFFQNELPGLITTGRERWQRSRDRIAQRAGNQPPQPPAAGSSAAGPSAVTVGFSKNTPTVVPSSGSPAASPPHNTSSAPKDSAAQQADDAHENLGDPQAALQALIDASNTWSHPATDADKQDAKRLLGDLMRSQGVDRSLVDRLAELIDDPDSISQHQFAICALNSVLHTQLTSDLAGFARVVAAEFTGKLFDRDGKLLADFSLDTQGENNATATALPTDPIHRVIRGELPLQDAPIGNKLLQNGVKKAAAKRADLERKGSAFSDAHVLDYLLARGLGKMLSKLAPEQYQADAKYTAGVIPGYLDNTATRAKDAKGPSKKLGDLLLSADSLVTLFTDILGGNAQTLVAGDNYDVGRINDVLARPEQAPFVLATFLDGNGLVERADAFAKDPTKARPFDTVGNIGTSSAHQVVINGKITEDGDHYVVPLHTWQQSFSIKVKKDALPSLFPVFTYGNYLPSGAPGANDATQSQAPENNPWTQLTTGGDDKLGTGGHGIAGLVSNKGAPAREQALAQQYNLQIGPGNDAGGKHFSHKMLDRIEKVLAELPPDHVTGNPTLRTIIRDISSEQSASAYDELTDTINVVNPKDMPSWLYSRLNRGVSWQRYLMDRGATGDYEGISKEQDKALGITGRRQVMAGVSDVLANGNLVKWTLRHEIGHSIDKLIDWKSLAEDDKFGGWKVHSDTRDIEDVARAIFAKAGITDDEANTETDGFSLLQRFASVLHPPSRRKDMAPLVEFPASAAPLDADLRKKLEKAVRTVKIAMAQPWTLVDGGASELQVEDRIYHVDHYNQWVSYRADARDNAVSNYQFSTPAEWFAEAYASYYDPDPAPKTRLTQDVRDFFENELPDRVTTGHETWQRIRESIARSAGQQPQEGSSASAITSGFNPEASGDPADVPLRAPIDALVRTLVAKSGAWSSPRTLADKQEAIALVTELLQQLGMDAKVVDRAGEQGKDAPDDEHSACTCVR
ncbi:hypothetical protein WME75_36815 [Sorangium sp. So ce1014]|uniref:hypothetical protein n=1 Tax=Sorangium sp. So ce1014 TaxID=3133326 RepID=UPI003F5ECD50